MKRENDETFEDYKLRRKLNRILVDRELCGRFYAEPPKVSTYAADEYYRIKWQKLVQGAKNDIQM